MLLAGRAGLGRKSFLPAAIQAPIIVTFHAPHSPRYLFRNFYDAVKARGYILYPGKLTTIETFRVGCMGQLGERGMAGTWAPVAGEPPGPDRLDNGHPAPQAANSPSPRRR